jgi:hypothetical protein
MIRGPWPGSTGPDALREPVTVSLDAEALSALHLAAALEYSQRRTAKEATPSLSWDDTDALRRALRALEEADR